MSTRHEDNDGSDIFWPGYVDATTNLILNLLFLLTILMIAVFMFALELGRSSPVEAIKPPVTSTTQDAESVATTTTGPLEVVATATNDLSEAIAAATIDLSETITSVTDESVDAAAVVNNEAMDSAPLAAAGLVDAEAMAMTDFSEAVSLATTDFSDAVSLAMTDSAEENAALKLEVQRLSRLLENQLKEDDSSEAMTSTVDATSLVPKPQIGLERAMTGDYEVVVHFMDEAIALTALEREELLESLTPLAEGEKASIYVEVPTGFSEAKRMGFYRAMAVRNVLLEMKIPQENIDVTVIEGSSKANASLVKVRPR